jgi:catechol-2,3-dioxygenase
MVTVGRGRLGFTAAAGGLRPFYHFALLVPGARFPAAHGWLAERAELLGDPETGDTVFAFDAWDARAAYCHDPAGNILEIIGHADTPAAVPADEAFRSEEVVAISEVGLVTADPPGAAEVLARDLGLAVWSGRVPTDASGLAFVGRKAHTLILCAPGRGWLPTGRPAEPHAVDVTLSGASERAAALPGGPLCVRRAP